MVWSYQVGRALHLRHCGTWGDLRHWELFIGRLQVYRWCAGAPCHLTPSGHPIGLHWRRR